MSIKNKSALYGLMAEFEHPQDLMGATTAAFLLGYREMDAYSPFPVEGMADMLHKHKNRLPKLVLMGGIVGAILGFAFQYYAAVIDYPINVGGRPFNSWPSFIPITFEVTILVAAFTAVLGMFALNGLPEPYHPVFNVERFSRASRDRFFLCIETKDEKFNPIETKKFLESFKPVGVYEVEP